MLREEPRREVDAVRESRRENKQAGKRERAGGNSLAHTQSTNHGPLASGPASQPTNQPNKQPDSHPPIQPTNHSTHQLFNLPTKHLINQLIHLPNSRPPNTKQTKPQANQTATNPTNQPTQPNKHTPAATQSPNKHANQSANPPTTRTTHSPTSPTPLPPHTPIYMASFLRSRGVGERQGPHRGLLSLRPKSRPTQPPTQPNPTQPYPTEQPRLKYTKTSMSQPTNKPTSKQTHQPLPAPPTPPPPPPHLTSQYPWHPWGSQRRARATKPSQRAVEPTPQTWQSGGKPAAPSQRAGFPQASHRE